MNVIKNLNKNINKNNKNLINSTPIKRKVLLKTEVNINLKNLDNKNNNRKSAKKYNLDTKNINYRELKPVISIRNIYKQNRLLSNKQSIDLNSNINSALLSHKYNIKNETEYKIINTEKKNMNVILEPIGKITYSGKKIYKRNNIIDIAIIKRDYNLFQKEFEKIQKKPNIKLSELDDLMKHNNSDVKFLTFYLNFIKIKDSKLYKAKIILLYPIIPKEICINEFNIKKKLSEKERFYDILNKINDSNLEELNKIINDEYQFPDELQIFELSKKEKEDYNRWKVYCNKILKFSNNDNEEYFYYSLSGFILNNFIDRKINKENYLNLIRKFYPLLQKIKNNQNNNLKLFEYIILFLLNSQNDEYLHHISNIDLCYAFIQAISSEINHVKSLDEEKIKRKFLKERIEAKISGNNIYLSKGKENSIIEGYKNYNITEECIKNISSDLERTKNKIEYFRKFEYLINPKNYFDGLLYQIIEKYVSSKLCKTSIYRCFNMEEKKYSEIEKEIFSPEIHKYIRMIPYNSSNDTGRTLKKFALIIIDPSKQKMIVRFINNIIKDNELLAYLEKYINIVSRKFIFMHEHHHLCNNLLFYFYTNKSKDINTPPKYVDNNNNVIELEEANSKKNSIKEAGYIFEILTFGKIQRFFTLKQLLFIGNEENDKLAIEDYKKKFIEISNEKMNTEKLFAQYDGNQILKNLVSIIYKKLKEQFKDKINDMFDTLLVCQNEFETINSINDFGEQIITEGIDHYDCHIYGEYYYSGERYNDDN